MDSDAVVLWDAFGATSDVFGGFLDQLDLGARLLQYWRDWQVLGLRKDILNLGMRPSDFRLPEEPLPQWHMSALFYYVERNFEVMVFAENAGFGVDTAERTSMDLLERIRTDRHDYIHGVLTKCKTGHPEANNRVLYFIETAALVAYSNQASIEVANASRTVVEACASNNASTRISEVAKNIIEADAQAAIAGIRSRERIMSTAGKAEKAVQCIAKTAASSVSLPLPAAFKFPGHHLYRGGAETSPPDFWIRLCRVALRRYRSSSACLSTTAIESFIVHLQDGGDARGTAPLILKEDYDDSPFELGPSSTIRRVYSSGDVVLEWGGGLKATISEKDLMMEAEARGLFDRETSSNMLQATLHDLIIDSTDAITSIQYLDGLEAHDYSDRPSWENSKVDLCRRFLSSFMPSDGNLGCWDDCTARHALRDKRRPGLHFDFYLQTTLKLIRASLLQRRQAQLQWRWSAHNSCTFEGDTLIANGYYLDTIVLVGKGIYVAERVTHGTSVVQREIWKTVPWRPLEPRVSLVTLEDELDRLNGKLFKLQQSSRWHRNLVTSKSVGLRLVAFASAVAAIGSIVAAARPELVGLAVVGLTAAVAAFLLSFLDYAIERQQKKTARKIADATQARTRYEGDSGDKMWLEGV